ncbi:hypothetical protein [Pseudoxanthomonas winnipegensis]|uniref:hypothetical protein n=1 Tax=Pseudoxanthomonas winnipegensis TaxID=2480810 RepID=UPI00103C2EF6|nr:hypothetical protein [Pseudoxanthomonas winnipegensis]TBV69768.1 hypothetical protein EYC45_19155 [Pseudoxanthomonas winnipegensis]
MSYIIAFVELPGTDGDYPVECYRTDLRPNDEVIISLPKRGYRFAKVIKTSFLNWDCKGRVECLKSEAVRDADGSLIPPIDAPRILGLCSIDTTVTHLRMHGWTPVRTHSTQYRIGVTHSNDTQTAYILFRMNGVDINLFKGKEEPRPAPFSKVSSSPEGGRTVRHFLSQTTFNLFEGIARFSQSFLANTNDYDRFFQPVGSTDRATAEVRHRVQRAGGEAAEPSLRDALRGCEDGEGRIYLSDGVYL